MGYAITTRYAGPTTYRGSRVIGTGPALKIGGHPVRATVEWDYGAGNPASDLCGFVPGASFCYRMLGHDGAHDLKPRTYVYAGWGDSDANHRRAADAVVAKLRADNWDVTLAADDRGATLPDERGNVYVLHYGTGER